MSIYSKIAQVMTDVQYLNKDGKIDPLSSGKSYKVITEEKVTTAVRTAMVKYGLVLYPESIEEQTDTETYEKEYNGKKSLVTNRFCRVKITYTMVDTDSGESVTIQSCGSGVDTQDKAVGKAMTYAYKYALLRTFAIPTGEDPDLVASSDYDEMLHGSSKPRPPETQNRVPTCEEYEKLIGETLIAVEGDADKVESYCKKNFGTTDATTLTLEQLTKMHDAIIAWRRKQDEKTASSK